MKIRIIKIQSGLRLLMAAAVLALSLTGCSGSGGGGETTGGTTGGSTGTTTTVPAAPGSPSALPGSGQVTLSWNAVSGATSYNLYWRTASGVTTANGTKITGISSPHMHSSLTNGTAYYYAVTAVNSAGESAASAQVSATPNASATATYTIGGYLVGLAAGQSVVLQDNGGDNLTVSANGAFTFATGVAASATYKVTLLTQALNGQQCAIANNSTVASASTGVGLVSSSNIDTVRVICGSVFTFAGSGLAGQGDTTGVEAVFNGPSGAAFDTAGNLYVADAVSNVIRKISLSGAATTLAGSGLAGYAEGTGTAAQFNFSTGVAGVAVDSAGNVYVGDTANNVIRMITSAGTVTTLAGSGVAGYANGTGALAKFNSPQGVAVDSTGNVYVADYYNHKIRKITSTGVVTTLAGSLYSGFVNGTGAAASFRYPASIALDASGNAYVGDSENHAIRKIVMATAAVTTLAGGSTFGEYLDATGTSARFNTPKNTAVDATGNVYVADSGNKVVRMITPAGVASTLAGSTLTGSSDGPATVAKFNLVQGVAADATGNVYVTDRSANRIRKISAVPYSYTVNGHVVGLSSGSTLVLQNNAADNLTINANGSFTFAAPLTNTSGAASYGVTVLTPPTGQNCTVANGAGGFTGGDVWAVNINCAAVSTFAGSGTSGYLDGPAASAKFYFSAQYVTSSAIGVAVDTAGNVYIADAQNNRIRKITSAGVVTTLAGSGLSGSTDGTGTAASFCAPAGLAVDTAGYVYVADACSNKIRKITSSGVVTTLAGNLYSGYADGTGDAAKFNGPTGVAVDAAGNVYVADSLNHAIRRISPVGVVTTLAGSAAPTVNGGYIDGIGSAARFAQPHDVALDSAGNVYVADWNNQAVRKVTPTGIVSTLAGPGQDLTWASRTGYVDSTGVSALFGGPTSIAVDASGNVYVTDTPNNAIRRINPSGTVTTLAGPAAPLTTAGFTNGNGASALFNVPNGIALDAAGNLYVADVKNNVIRKIAQ